MPALIICGERDEACVQASEFMGRVIPRARVWTVPGATHFVNLDEPVAFNRAVLAFLGGLRRA